MHRMHDITGPNTFHTNTSVKLEHMPYPGNYICITTISYEHSVWASSPCMDTIRDTATTPRKPKILVTRHVHVASRNHVHDHWKQDEV